MDNAKLWRKLENRLKSRQERNGPIEERGEYFVMDKEGIVNTNNEQFKRLGDNDYERANRKTVFERQMGARNVIYEHQLKKHENNLMTEVEQTLKLIQNTKHEAESDYHILHLDKKRYHLDGGTQKTGGDATSDKNVFNSEMNTSDKKMMMFHKMKAFYLDKGNPIPARKISLPDKLPSAVADARKIMQQKSLDKQADVIKGKITERLYPSNTTDAAYGSLSSDTSSPESVKSFIKRNEDDDLKHIQNVEAENFQIRLKVDDGHFSKVSLPPIESQALLSPRYSYAFQKRLPESGSFKGSVTHRSNSQNNQNGPNHKVHVRIGSRDDSMIKYTKNSPKCFIRSISQKDRVQHSLRKSKEKADESSRILQNKVESFLKTFENNSSLTLYDVDKVGADGQKETVKEKHRRIIPRSQSRRSSINRPYMSPHDRAIARWRRAIHKIIFKIALKKMEHHLRTIAKNSKYQIFNDGVQKRRPSNVSRYSESTLSIKSRHNSAVPLNTAERAKRHSDSYRLQKLIRESLQEMLPNSHLYDLSEDTDQRHTIQQRCKRNTIKR